MQVKIETITPEKAKQILENQNKQNRSLNFQHVKSLANMMKNNQLLIVENQINQVVKIAMKENQDILVFMAHKPIKPYTIQNFLNDHPEIKQNSTIREEIENRFLVNLDEKC